MLVDVDQEVREMSTAVACEKVQRVVAYVGAAMDVASCERVLRKDWPHDSNEPLELTVCRMGDVESEGAKQGFASLVLLCPSQGYSHSIIEGSP